MPETVNPDFGPDEEGLQGWIFDGESAALRIDALGRVLFTSPNGNYHRLVVADDGSLSTEAV